MNRQEGFTEEDLIAKVGGRFRLSVLLQKRLQEMNRGSQPMVQVRSKTPLETVYAEIAEDKLAFEPLTYDDKDDEAGLEDLTSTEG